MFPQTQFRSYPQFKQRIKKTVWNYGNNFSHTSGRLFHLLSTKTFNDTNKECALHILAPAAVACDIYIVRRSAHPCKLACFCCIGDSNGISYTVKQLPEGSHYFLLSLLRSSCMDFIAFSVLSNLICAETSSCFKSYNSFSFAAKSSSNREICFFALK